MRKPLVGRSVFVKRKVVMRPRKGGKFVAGEKLTSVPVSMCARNEIFAKAKLAASSTSPGRCGKSRCRPVCRIMRPGGNAPSWGAVVNEESSERVMSQLACHARSVLRIGDASREEQIDGRLEEGGILQKKGPLFGEEDFETLIHSHLGLVGLHLAEVRVQREIQHQAVFQDRFGVETQIHLGRFSVKPRRRVEGIEGAE